MANAQHRHVHQGVLPGQDRGLHDEQEHGGLEDQQLPARAEKQRGGQHQRNQQAGVVEREAVHVGQEDHVRNHQVDHHVVDVGEIAAYDRPAEGRGVDQARDGRQPQAHGGINSQVGQQPGFQGHHQRQPGQQGQVQEALEGVVPESQRELEAVAAIHVVPSGAPKLGRPPRPVPMRRREMAGIPPGTSTEWDRPAAAGEGPGPAVARTAAPRPILTFPTRTPYPYANALSAAGQALAAPARSARPRIFIFGGYGPP